MTCEGRNLPRLINRTKTYFVNRRSAVAGVQQRAEASRARKLTNARVDVHVHVHG